MATHFWYILLTIALTVFLAPLFIGLWQGFDRKLTAKLQSRKGPPLLQPFYDLIKLFAKHRGITNPWQSFCATVYLISEIAALVLFFLGADLLLVFFTSAAGTVFYVMGALCVSSPYGQIGAQRELLQILAYEPLLFLAIAGFYLATGSFMIGRIAFTTSPLLYQLPLMAIVLGYVLTIKLKKSPFDIASCHHAHQEIVRGIQTEFSGITLGMTELAHWYEIALILGICCLLWTSLAGIITILALAFILEIFIDNICARATWNFMLLHVWGVGLSLAIINLLWLGMGR